MKSIVFTSILVFGIVQVVAGTAGLVSEVAATPRVQDEAKELEAMIMRQIEEKRKAIDAERAAKGLPPVDYSDEKNLGINPAAGNSTPSRSVRRFGGSDSSNANRNSPRREGILGTPVPANRATDSAVPQDAVTGDSVIPRVRRSEQVPQFTEATEMVGSRNVELDPDFRIGFNFVQEEWKDVIEWFAEQVGFGVFYGQTGPPQGTFSYFDSTERTVLEALDFLNSRLAVLNPSHVLVRNGNQLVLVNESLGYPDHLIARIWEDELDQYGDYEVVSCVFDLKSLNGNELAVQLRQDVTDVHLDGFAYTQAANHLTIRERVRVLKRFRDLITFAKRKDNVITITTYEVKHVEPVVLLVTLRQLMGFDDETNVLPDGSLTISVQPLGNTVYLKGTPERIDEFQDIAALIDVPFDGDDRMVERPYFHVHRISGDAEVIFQVLQTLLDGEPNVKLDQDSKSGDVFLWAGKRVHDYVADLLNAVTTGDSFDIVVLKNLRPRDAVSTVEKLLGIDSFSDTASGPKLVSDTDNNRVLVHGTPQQIALVRSILEKVDAQATSELGYRRSTRVIHTSPRKAENILSVLQIPEIMDSIGRSNRLNLIMPAQRKDFRNRSAFERNYRNSESQYEPGQPSQPDPRMDDPDYYLDPTTNPHRTNSGHPTNRYETTQQTPQTNLYVNTPVRDEESVDDSNSKDSIGSTSNQGQDHGYRVPNEKPSVEGAPINIRATDFGFVITSEDLDAADDVETLIKSLLDTEGNLDLPSFFYLQFRQASEVKTVLDQILGLTSASGGGGGGGLGGLIGGALSNAVGGAAGDALGGLLGGGESSSGSGTSPIELEGENVQISVDTKQNVLIILGATANDLDFIAELIDAVDVPGPPQKPQLLGQTRSIPILYRDPMYVKEKVELQLADYFNKPASAGGNNPKANMEQAIQQQVLQQLQGGGRNRRGGGAANPEAERPKATLGVDELNNCLLVTGPEFIYDEVMALVRVLDIRQEVDTLTVRPNSVSPAAIVQYLKAVFDDKIEIVEDTDESAASGNQQNRNANPQQRTQRGGNTSGFQGGGFDRGAMERRIFEAMQNRGGGGRGQGGGRAFQQGPGR